MTWETVIGLEVHAQLNTQSKLFSGSATDFGRPPNSQTSFIDAGLPGVLPVLNQQAVIKAIQFGLAIQATINDQSFFERKNYFYPDLPKGYQISQYQRPIVSDGQLTLANDQVVIIERAHLEEDAGKSIHDQQPEFTGIDLNRAGIPLLEIVTTPCLFSATEAVLYLKTLHQLLRFLDICDGNMQEGSFRCDVNLSIRPQGSQQLGTRTELKNLNSFRFIEKAIVYEAARHQDLLENGHQVIQQTRLYCPDSNTTVVMRDKENANDYRYFPDPDLLPLHISTEELKRIEQHMPPLPASIAARLQQIDLLTADDCEFLLTAPSVVRYYEQVKAQSHAPNKTIVNWLKGPVQAVLNENNLSFEQLPIPPEQLAKLLDRLVDQVISAKAAKEIFTARLITSTDIDTLIATGGHQLQQDDSALEALIQQLIADYPQQMAEYRAGKQKLLAFFVGQIMKQTKGKASPERVNALLLAALNSN